MTILQQNIKSLRAAGKSYSQIEKELGCSKGTIAYNCCVGQKQKAKKRAKRHSTNKGALYKKLQGFCYNYGKARAKGANSPLLKLDEVLKKIGPAPTCYLTGEKIDLTDMASYSLDHITPLSRGGKSTLDNMGLSKRIANQAKSDLTKEEFINLCIKVLVHNSYTVEKN
jgi:CRISPR/Cas system Type II protein with McrA/HNH and RuvC-like nuclease domain